MAAKLSGGGGGKYAIEQNSEINVTPFVDIMLVLLIIFMVAAPLATVSVEVKLPRAVAPPQQNPPKPFYVSIQNDGSAYIGDNQVDISSVGSELTRLIGNKPPSDERIFIRADQQTRYGDFMQVMNSLQDHGFYSVALVGEDTSAK
jgi:biopolymer transport protein ExbD